MRDEKQPAKKSVFETLKNHKFAVGFIGILVFALIAAIFLNNQICADTTFNYDGANVPAKICITKSINYNIGGVVKSAVFTSDFVNTLKITGSTTNG